MNCDEPIKILAFAERSVPLSAKEPASENCELRTANYELNYISRARSTARITACALLIDS
jgi:hypothetical protein